MSKASDPSLRWNDGVGTFVGMTSGAGGTGDAYRFSTSVSSAVAAAVSASCFDAPSPSALAKVPSFTDTLNRGA